MKTRTTRPAVALCVLLPLFSGWAQSGVPTLVNYQGRLVDASGVPLETANRDLILNIYDAPTDGTVMYGPQSMPSTPVVNGFYNVLLGPVDQYNPPRPIESAFGGPDRYLEVTVQGTVMSPRQRILSAPYAFQALHSESAAMADAVKAGGVTAEMIAPNAVGSAQIQNDAVGAEKIADNAVGGAQIQSGAVGSEEIADGTVATPKLAANAVTREKIADGAISTSKFEETAEAPFSKLRYAVDVFEQYQWGDDQTQLYYVPDAQVTIEAPPGRIVEIFILDARIAGPTRIKSSHYNLEIVRIPGDVVVGQYNVIGGNLDGGHHDGDSHLHPGIQIVLPSSAFRAIDFSPVTALELASYTYRIRFSRTNQVSDPPAGGHFITTGKLVAIVH